MLKHCTRRSFCQGNYFNKFQELKANNKSYNSLWIRVKSKALYTFVIGSAVGFTLFSRYNPVSKEFKLFFVNEWINTAIANKISEYVQKQFENNIYLQNTEEVRRVDNIYNNLSFSNKITSGKVFVVNDSAYYSWIAGNGDLFVSDSLLNLCNDDELAFFIGCELGFLVRGDLNSRLFFKARALKRDLFLSLKGFTNSLQIFSLTKDFGKEKKKEWYLKYVNFYPQSCVSKQENCKNFRFVKGLMANSAFSYVEVTF